MLKRTPPLTPPVNYSGTLNVHKCAAQLCSISLSISVDQGTQITSHSLGSICLCSYCFSFAHKKKKEIREAHSLHPKWTYLFEHFRWFFMALRSREARFIKSVQAVDVPVMVFACWKSITLSRLSSLCIWHVQITRLCTHAHAYMWVNNAPTDALCANWLVHKHSLWFCVFVTNSQWWIGPFHFKQGENTCPRGPLCVEVLWSVHI